MVMTLPFDSTTTRTLADHLQAAFRQGDLPSIKRMMVLLLLSDSQPVSSVSARLGVSRATIYAWRHAFLVNGFASLCSRSSPGRPAKLTLSQKHQLQELLEAGPQGAGYPSGCWNSPLIQHLIQRTFGQRYNVQYLSAFMHQLGFSYQKARYVSDHLDEERRQHWLKQEWPAIREESRRRKTLLLFADEASFAQWGSLGYTWALKGHQPVVKTCGKRKGYKVFGMVDYITGRLFARGQTERFTAERYCDFLFSVLEATTDPIILVQDGAKYHTAARTQAFVAQHVDRVKTYQLPSYSPDYNPIEHLWRNIKRQWTHNRYFPTFDSLIQAVDAGLAHFQAHPAEVKQLMGTYLDQMAEVAQAQAA